MARSARSKWPLSLEVTTALIAFVALQGLLLLFWRCETAPATLPGAQLRSAWQSWPPPSISEARALAAKTGPEPSPVASTALVVAASHAPSTWQPAGGRKRIFLTISTGHTGEVDIATSCLRHSPVTEAGAAVPTLARALTSHPSPPSPPPPHLALAPSLSHHPFPQLRLQAPCSWCARCAAA